MGSDAGVEVGDAVVIESVDEVNEVWLDFRGCEWPLIRSCRRLKFKCPAHAALRAHVFYRDGFRCVRCDAHAVDVPPDYDGKSALFCNTSVRSKLGRGRYRLSPDVLILEHIVTLAAGGRNVVNNLQAMCETCNKKKIPEDRRAAAIYLAAIGPKRVQHQASTMLASV